MMYLANSAGDGEGPGLDGNRGGTFGAVLLPLHCHRLHTVHHLTQSIITYQIFKYYYLHISNPIFLLDIPVETN